MNKYVVYMHKNNANNKVYIGITSQNPIRRWANGKGYSQQPKFYNAILKYGWDNFTHEILYTGLTQKQACEKEQALIELYKSNKRNFGYNVSIGGKASNCRISKLELQTNCPICNTTFLRNYSSQKYCSKECQIKSMKKVRPRRICNYCGEEFELKRAISNDYKGEFCSHKCQIDYMRKCA